MNEGVYTMKTIEWGVSGNYERVFISTSFGCQYNCTYCYLREMGIDGIQCSFNKEELLAELDRRKIFVPGKQGSLITIGCYTECWDDINRATTIDIINYFLKQGNYVQLSTKKKLYDRDVSAIVNNIQFKGQMNIFISLPTISYANVFEPDADSPDLRKENFDIKYNYEIDVFLYIKPVIRTITIQDKEKYAELVREYNIPVVVGEMLYPTSTDEGRGLMIGNAFLKEKDCNDTNELLNYLQRYTDVYSHSDEAVRRQKR